MGAPAGSFKYSDAVELDVRPSRIGAVLVLAAALGTLIVLRSMSFGPWGYWIAGAVIGLAAHAFLAFARRRFRLRLDRWGAIALSEGGRVRAGFVQPRCFVAPWLTIVRWRPEGGRFDRTVVLLPDMVEAQVFRVARVLLKWGEAALEKSS